MKPVVHRLEADYWGRVDVVYLDRERSANADIVREYGIFGQPIFVLVDPNGQELQRWFGSVSDSALRAALDSYLDG